MTTLDDTLKIFTSQGRALVGAVALNAGSEALVSQKYVAFVNGRHNLVLIDSAGQEVANVPLLVGGDYSFSTSLKVGE